MESRTCPLPMITPFSREMLRLWPHWNRGVMAVSGGFYDQPNIIIEAMAFIGARIADEEAETARRAKRGTHGR